jgi:adenylate cyclase
MGSIHMIEPRGFENLRVWLAEAGVRGGLEDVVVSGFCERAAAAGLPIERAMVLIDTLHPVYEGRLFRWGHDASQPAVQEYGRTSLPKGVAELDPSAVRESPESVARWRASPFFRMLQTGESVLRRRITPDAIPDFPVLHDYQVEGMTDYIAVISRFGPHGTIGEMDCVCSSWVTGRPGGFSDDDFSVLIPLVSALAVSIKAVALTRMVGTLVQTYLGRDPGRRVLSGRIMRGVADRIDAVIWFSDLRGFTRITDSAPEQVIPLLNAYADVIVSAIDARGGDVVKLMGDGILAIFTAADRAHACAAALAAATAARTAVAALNSRRTESGLPVSDMYLGLHVGEVFYGNIGSTERLDFTVVGPAVNEASRIAAMCRSVEQPLLVSQAFATVAGVRDRLVSVGRYALRGVAQPQELFTLDRAELDGPAPNEPRQPR